jgi:hypothetical protein
MNAMCCSAMQVHDDNDGKQLKKTVSTLFKLTYKDKPTKAKEQKEFYKQCLTNFKQHTQELRNAIHMPEIGYYEVHPTPSIRLTIITNDLIPLKYKICNLLNCIETHSLYRTNYKNQKLRNPDESPRIRIIDSMINILQDLTIPLNDTHIENYQLLINHIADFSVKKGHDRTIAYNDSWVHQHDAQILAALEIVDKDNAQMFATLLNEETLNEEQLIQCKKNIENIQQQKINSMNKTYDITDEDSDENDEICDCI